MVEATFTLHKRPRTDASLHVCCLDTNEGGCAVVGRKGVMHYIGATNRTASDNVQDRPHIA